MKHPYPFLIAGLISVFLFMAGGAGAQTDLTEDRTLSPYFFVKSDDPDLDRLPLKSTSAEVNISGVIADVRVIQLYKNEGQRPLEAMYTFPASTRAAVYGMKMTIGERTVVARIEKREEARRAYEQAKEEGKSASLLEQQRPNVFQMNVANILPSDEITVELRYTELLVPTGGVYEFIYPTVVGPRYSNRPAEGAPPGEKWVQNPYLHEGEAPTYAFDLSVHLSAGLPIQEATCTSHKVEVRYEGPAFASLRLDSSEKSGGNRDFILKYRLAGNQIQTGLLLFEGKKENFFLAMIQPPGRITTEQIPPREYFFIVDVSGSMHGFPLDISKKLLRDLIVNLRPTDRFNVLLFAGGSSLLSEQSLPASLDNVQRALTLIERQRGGGGTNLLPALKRALAIPRAEGVSRSVVIATDGFVAVEEEAFDLIRKSLGQANMFAFGIGSSVNRHLIEGMARVGMGEPFIITQPEEAPEKARKFRELIQSPVLTDVRVHFGRFETFDVEPPSIPDVLAERPVIIFGKWRGKPEGLIELTGRSGERLIKQTIEVAGIEPYENNSALRYLWARHRIALLSDYNKLQPRNERAREVTNLGLTYNLLTAYTSFVAIDTLARLKGDKAAMVKQPLPLPQGVSDLAVGQGASRKQTFLAPSPSYSGRDKGAEYTKTLTECKEEVARPESEPRADIKNLPIRIQKISVSGGLAESNVRAVLEKEMPGLNRCYRAGAGATAVAGKKMTFQLTIDSDGRVKGVKELEHGEALKDLEQCLVERLQALRFPSSSGIVTITVTFILR